MLVNGIYIVFTAPSYIVHANGCVGRHFHLHPLSTAQPQSVNDQVDNGGSRNVQNACAA